MALWRSLLNWLGNSQWLKLFGKLGIELVNIGIFVGMVFLVLMLLRPVTNRLLTPRCRVAVWFVGWYGGFLAGSIDLLGRIRILPVTFRALVTPRPATSYITTPAYLADTLGNAGEYTVALPGGVQFSLSVGDAFIGAFGLISAVSLLSALGFCYWQERCVRRLGQRGIRMGQEQLEAYGVNRENVAVRLCDDLPTSFVRFGHDTGIGDGIRCVICLQKDLTEEQMRLVLLHEMEHIKMHHVWWKGTMTAALAFMWWNPIFWLVFQLTCRDMELACDQAVMEQLGEEKRRAYARTLVELGAGKQLWGTVTAFGENDIAVRVRRMVRWKPETLVVRWGSGMLTVLLILFFYTGAPRVQIEAKESFEDFVTGGSLQESWHSQGIERVEIAEVWVLDVQVRKGEKRVYIQAVNGNWYFCSYRLIDGFYRMREMSSLPEEPDLSAAQQLLP